MSQKANPTLIGAFVVGALLIGIAALVTLGSGEMFKKTERYVMYFEGNLAGLDPGAPVEYHGVQLGSITEIRLEYNTDTEKALIPVYMEFDPANITYTGKTGRSQGLGNRIEMGLRAQLQSQSLLTGKQKIMLLEAPDSPVKLVGADPSVPEIPTIPTLTESFMHSLEKVRIGDMISNVSIALQDIAELTSSSAGGELLASLSRSSASLDELLARLDSSLPALVTTVTEAAATLDETLANVNGMVESRSPVRYELSAALEQIGAAADSLRELADYLQRHPESLLSGKQQSGLE